MIIEKSQNKLILLKGNITLLILMRCKIMKGLTNQEVLKRIQEGQVNTLPKPLVKSYKQIICEHVFNLFNIYNFIIACTLALVKAWTSMFFIVLVTSNVVIRISQEIKSRNMVAKLNLIISPKTKVLRDGVVLSIDNEEIVLGDYIYLETGNQIPADCVVLDNDVEVDESLLTGEADPVLKKQVIICYQEVLLFLVHVMVKLSILVLIIMQLKLQMKQENVNQCNRI